jgi:hypothetical protein
MRRLQTLEITAPIDYLPLEAYDDTSQLKDIHLP